MNEDLNEEQLALLGLSKEQFATLQEEARDRTPFERDEHGRYAWDRWQERAIAAGVTKDLASLGRAVMVSFRQMHLF